MFKLHRLCIASLIVLHAPTAGAQATPTAAEAQQQYDAVLAPFFKPDGPGASVIVVKDGKTVFRKGFGLADVARGVPMDAGAQHRLGSITKQFTATAILLLAEEGKLSLDDDITRHLPDYPTQGRRITIEHLLTHTSGIASYTSKRSFVEEIGVDKTVSAMIDSFKNDPFTFEPGTKYAYNNSAYYLLGAIIEKVSGKPYGQFVDERIFTPLGMLDTAYEGREKGKAPRAAGHTVTKTGYAPSVRMSPSAPYSAGAILSTVDDMARWDSAITAGKLLKAASWQRAFTSYRLNDGTPTGYGYGWHVGTLQGSPLLNHGGGIPGFSTHAMRLPKEKVFVAVLRNNDKDPVSSEVIASLLAGVAIGKPFPQFAPVSLPAPQLEAVAGAYRGDDNTVRTFSVENGKLYMQRGDRPKAEVLAYGPDRFYLPNTLVHLSFSRDENGAVNAVTVHQNDTAQTSPRLAAR